VQRRGSSPRHEITERVVAAAAEWPTFVGAVAGLSSSSRMPDHLIRASADIE
jgi:hypothetical protein